MNVAQTMKKNINHPFLFLVFLLQLSVPFYLIIYYIITQTSNNTRIDGVLVMRGSPKIYLIIDMLFEYMVISYALSFFLILFLIIARKQIPSFIIYFFGINIIMLILHFIVQYFLYFF